APDSPPDGDEADEQRQAEDRHGHTEATPGPGAEPARQQGHGDRVRREHQAEEHRHEQAHTAQESPSHPPPRGGTGRRERLALRPPWRTTPPPGPPAETWPVAKVCGTALLLTHRRSGTRPRAP